MTAWTVTMHLGVLLFVSSIVLLVSGFVFISQRILSNTHDLSRRLVMNGDSLQYVLMAGGRIWEAEPPFLCRPLVPAIAGALFPK